MSTNSTQDKTRANTCHSPVFPRNRTKSPTTPPPTHTHTRARAHTHAHTRTPGHIAYFSICSIGRRTRLAPTAVAPASPIQLSPRLHQQKHTQTQTTAPAGAHDIAQRSCASAHQDHAKTTAPGTLRTPATAAGAGRPGLHRWPSHPTHRNYSCPVCTIANRTHSTTIITNVCNRPALRAPARARTTSPHTRPGTQRTPVSAAGARRPSLQQRPRHPRHRYGCLPGCTTTDRTHNDNTFTIACHRPASHLQALRPRARIHNDFVHTAEHTTHFSVCSWGTWTRAAPMAAAPGSPIPS
jgi:hypothetical protein